MKKLFLLIILTIGLIGCSKNDTLNEPIIPVSLVGIEAVNIDNSGEFPIVSAAPIKKEAYMIGIKWITAYTASSDDDKFITGPIQKGENTYSGLSNKYSKAIKCNDQFKVNIPAGSYVSKFFKEINRNYLPPEIDEGFVLLVAPDSGVHSFRVEYYEGENLVFFYDTPLINFF